MDNSKIEEGNALLDADEEKVNMEEGNSTMSNNEKEYINNTIAELMSLNLKGTSETSNEDDGNHSIENDNEEPTSPAILPPNKEKKPVVEELVHKYPWYRSRLCIGLFGVLLMASIAAFVSVMITKPFTMPPTMLPTAIPTDSPTTQIPTKPPTNAPTTVPTESPTTASPSDLPSLTPTKAPTSYPTTSPSSLPTQLPSDLPSKIPTQIPTQLPTNSPTVDELMIMLESFTPSQSFETRRSPQGSAYNWLKREDQISVPIDQVKQRYALLALDFSTNYYSSADFAFARGDKHECTWEGITCNSNNTVTGINWAKKGLDGFVVDEIKLLDSLKNLDLAENYLRGTLDRFWEVPTLQNLYLHDNLFSGRLSDEIKNMKQLEKLYLGNNQLVGTIPSPLIRGGNRLRYLILNNNYLTGTIPEGLILRKLFYLDLGHNALTGALPSDWMNATNAIRHLYLDHNQLSGSIPDYFSMLGNGRLKIFYVNNNAFTGEVPTYFGDHAAYTTLMLMNVQNNNFTFMDKSICDYIVFNEGEMVELRTDCDICRCKHLCNTCDGKKPKRFRLAS